MDWYYALNDEQKGPVSEEELNQLVETGVISAADLVWREGMADWIPYAQAFPSSEAARVACSQCGGMFSRDEIIEVGGENTCATCKPVLLQKIREGAATSGVSSHERIRKEHIKHEVSIKSVGILYYVGGAALIVAGIALLFAASEAGNAERMEMMITAPIALIFSALYFAVGVGVRKLRRWTRPVVGVLSALGLCSVPVGTLINGYILWLFFSEKGGTVFSEEYQRVIESTPHIKYKTPVIAWIVLGLLIAACGIGAIFAFQG